MENLIGRLTIYAGHGERKVLALLTRERTTWDRAKGCNCSKAQISPQRCGSSDRSIDKSSYLLVRLDRRSLLASRSGMLGRT